MPGLWGYWHKKHVLTGRCGSQQVVKHTLVSSVTEVCNGYVRGTLRTGSFHLCSTPLPGSPLVLQIFCWRHYRCNLHILPIILLRLSFCTGYLNGRMGHNPSSCPFGFSSDNNFCKRELGVFVTCRFCGRRCLTTALNDLIIPWVPFKGNYSPIQEREVQLSLAQPGLPSGLGLLWRSFQYLRKALVGWWGVHVTQSPH